MTTLDDLKGYLDDEAYTVRVGELRTLLSAGIAGAAGVRRTTFCMEDCTCAREFGEPVCTIALLSASIADTAPVEMTIDEASAVEFYAQNPAVALQDFKASYKKLRDSVIGTPEVQRPETTSEHIARDIREGRFPQRSEPQMIADTAGAKAVALTDTETIATGKGDPIAWAVPVEIEHMQKGYRNSAVICNRNEGAYTQPVYLTISAAECKKSSASHPCNLGEGHEGPCGMSECSLPPNGWRCTRATGHAGPCAAIRKEI